MNQKILISILSLCIFLSACSSLKTRKDLSKKAPTTKSGQLPPSAPALPSTSGIVPVAPDDYEDTGDGAAQTESGGEAPPAVLPAMPKVGLILGPGAMKTYAHIGVLQELSRKRIPIHAIAGIEMGALVAGFYAHKGQAFDPEWQMFKLKEEDLISRQLLSSSVKAKKAEDLRPLFKDSLSQIKVDGTRVPFTCPLWDLKSNQTLMAVKGALDEAVMSCMSFAPLFRTSRSQWIAAFDLKATADQLRAMGANVVVYVSVVGENEDLKLGEEHEKWLWSLGRGQIQKQISGIHHVIQVDTRGTDLLDFSARKSLVQKGAESTKSAADQMIKKFGL